MNIQILISKNSWANNYSKDIKKKLKKYTKNLLILNNHKKLKSKYDINIIFSYFKIIEKKYLEKSNYNLVTHDSDLPKGRGMSPVTWEILKGKSEITLSLIEANEKMDAGAIYFKKKIKIDKGLVFNEIKKIQFNSNMDLIIKFLKFYKKNKTAPSSKKQKGVATYYKLRKPADSRININKSLKSQFNLMRVCDYENYPCHFYFNKKKYLINLIKIK